MDVLSPPGAVAGDVALRVERVGVEYAGAKGRVRALSGVSFDVARGSFQAIVGRSGSGKSTLLRVIAGLIQPTEGRAFIDGHRIDEPPAEARFVEQDYTQTLLPWKTVEANVRFGMRHAVRRGQDPEATVSRLIDLVGLGDARRRYPRELSGGMQQRVAIARALASGPDLLLLDEAFSSVDALSRARLQDMMLDLWSTLGFTAVLVTHDVDEAVYLADRVLVMDRKGVGLAAAIDVDLPRPRDQVETRESPQYLRYRRELVRRVLEDDGN